MTHQPEFSRATFRPPLWNEPARHEPPGRAWTETLADEPVTRLRAAFPSATNYVLTVVSEQGVDVSGAIEAARARGYANKDTTDDLDGSAEASNAAVVSSLVFGIAVSPEDVFRKGIQELSVADLVAAKRLGFTIRHLMTAEVYSGFLSVAAEPHAVGVSHPLSQVDGTNTMMMLDAAPTGCVEFSGSAVGEDGAIAPALADICHALGTERSSERARTSSVEKVLGPTDRPGRFMVRFQVLSPAATDAIRGCLFSHGIGMDHGSYSESRLGDEVVVLTDLGERPCIEGAAATLEDHNIFCLSVVRIFEE